MIKTANSSKFIFIRKAGPIVSPVFDIHVSLQGG